jgi:ubiquitin-like-conjugating enzyme ATG10
MLQPPDFSEAAGSPLPLERLLDSSVFHGSASSALRAPEPGVTATFPPISQAEHPVTGQPCFSLHPCETANILSEVMEAGGNEMSPVAVLEAWLSVVGAVVNLRD